MAIRGLQASFSGGEFAPSLHGRVDLQKYSTGLKKARNFIIHPQGGASNRPGTKYIATSKTLGKKVRLVPFEFSTIQAYVIELGEGYARFYKDGGQIQKSSAAAWVTATPYVVGDFVTNGGTMYYCVTAHTSAALFATDLAAVRWVAQTIYEVPLPYVEADLPDLKFTQSADTLYILHQDYQPRTLARLAHDDWELALYDFTNGPFMLSNATAITLTASAVTGAAITLTASSALFNSSQVGSLWRLIHAIPAQAVTYTSAVSGQSSSIKAGGVYRIITRGTWSGTVTVQKSTDNGGTWTALRSYTSLSDINHNSFGEVDESCLIRIDFVRTAGTLIVDLSSDPFDWEGVVEITGYTSATQLTATVASQLGNTTATADWAEGSWSNYRGWPACATFFQDRLVFAATPTEPQTIWMTETGNYTGFARSTPLIDSDGITINLASRKLNGIRSLTAFDSLLVLTSSSEFTVGGASDETISPTSISTRARGQRGSNGVDPLVIGNRAIYVQPQGSVVRDIGFEENGLVLGGTDLSIISNHFFRNLEIIDLAYQQEPDSLIWAVRDDGVLLSMTYMIEHEVLAWTMHETEGTVESVCVIPGADHDELWLSVKRGTARFIEQMQPRMISTDPRDQFFVDAGLSLDSPKVITGATKANPVVITSNAHGFANGDRVNILNVLGMTDINGGNFLVAGVAANTFQLTDENGANIDGTAFGTYISGGEARKSVSSVTGLSHLNGMTVAILGDGSAYPQQTVSAGAVALSPPAAIVHVGLPYVAKLQTLRPEIGLRDGTTQGRKLRVAELKIRFLESVGGFVGPDDPDEATVSNPLPDLEEIIQRTSEPLDSPVELKTQDYTMAIAANFESGGTVYYEQRDPLPTTILAVIPKYDVGG